MVCVTLSIPAVFRGVLLRFFRVSLLQELASKGYPIKWNGDLKPQINADGRR
jgi:hypothetical protein